MKKTTKNTKKSNQRSKESQRASTSQSTQPLSYTSYRSGTNIGAPYNLEEYRKTKGQGPKSKETYPNPYTTRYQKPNPKPTVKAAGSQTAPTKSPELRRAEIKKKNKLTRTEILKMKERKRKAHQFRLFGAAVVIVFCVYASIKLVQALNYPKISYQTVQMGVIDNSKKLEGLIAREESVYASQATGNLHYLVNEGQKVAKNKEVGMIVEDEAVQSLGAQIEDIDRSIYNLQEKRENLSTYQPELYSLNTLVSQEMNQFYNQFEKVDTDRVYVLRKELNHIIQTRTNIYVEDNNTRTKNLQSDRVNLSQTLQGKKNIVYAKHAGVVSYNIDGQESTLSHKNIETMNFAQYKELLSMSKKNEGAKAVLYAVDKEPLFKIITNDKWSIVTYLSLEEAAKYEQGQKYELIFPEVGNIRVLFTLVSKEDQDNKSKLVFETRDQITKFLPYRTIEFTVGETRAEGLKIPLQAVLEKNLFPIPEEYTTEKDHEKGVMRQKNGVVEFIPIQIQYMDEGKAYMIQEMNKTGAIMVGDVLKHPTNESTFTVKEVMTEQGVYTVNGRYARFKPVEVIMSNEDYGIVSLGGKTKLKEFDQIISNPKSINQDQLLRYMNIQNE